MAIRDAAGVLKKDGGRCLTIATVVGMTTFVDVVNMAAMGCTVHNSENWLA